MNTAQRIITVLGSTGSIGTQTLNIISRNPEVYSLRWITCNTRVAELAEQVQQYKPYGVAIRDKQAFQQFKQLCPDFSGPILCGEDGLCLAASDPQNTIVMSAMVGFSGVVPTLAAIRAGHTIGLANKETLVSAGSIITTECRVYGATLLAVDSEHSAILQCLAGERLGEVEEFVITASGGPFRDFTLEQMQHVTASQALKHPNWTMGAKITIDSATLMNKGFEVIEARWLFDVPSDRIKVVVHPQSIIHSMVQFVDGSIKAQLGLPSMLLPIQYALTYPRREFLAGERLNLTQLQQLTFFEPDLSRFPCLRIAYDVLAVGGSAACVANAANEIAVAKFLAGRITFPEIPAMIENALEHIEHVSDPSIADIIAIDAATREFCT